MAFLFFAIMDESIFSIVQKIMTDKQITGLTQAEVDQRIQNDRLIKPLMTSPKQLLK